MANYVIITQWSSGAPANGCRVMLSGQGFFGGTSDTVYTRRGVAVIEMDAVPVTVYVDGRDCGTARPGKFVVTID